MNRRTFGPRSRYFKALAAGAMFSICVACLIWGYRKSFTPIFEVKKGSWIEGGDLSVLKTMDRILKYSDLDLPKDSSVSFRLHAQKGFSDSILHMKITASEDYIRKVLEGNDFTTDWGEMKENERAVWEHDNIDPFLSAKEFLPKRVRRWWNPEGILDPRYVEKKSEDLPSSWYGIFGTGVEGDVILYLRIFRD